MSRSWTRSQQRRYREERQKRASLVADRLLGRKKYIPPAHDDLIDAMSYKWATNLFVERPRHNTTGFTGV